MAPGSRLVGLIDRYKADHPGMTDAVVARNLGMSAANLSLWRVEGVRDWPSRPTLDALASTTGRPYREILDAALFDTGYAAHPTPDATTRTYREVRDDAIRVLTEATRLTEFSSPGTRNPTASSSPIPIDWAILACQALAGATANAGGIDAVLSGQPTSWAADSVRRLLTATVGTDESALWQHRTEPLLVVIWPKQILADIGSSWFEDEGVDNRELAKERARGHDAFEQLRAQLDEVRRAELSDYGERIASKVREQLADALEDLQVPTIVIVAEHDVVTAGLEDAVGLEPRIVETAIKDAASSVRDPGTFPGTPLSRLIASQPK